jgi:cobalt/nickel transport system permease protein
MHIPDGVLSPAVLAVSSALACGGVSIGLNKIDHEEIPKAGILSAFFFVASLVHINLGVSSMHLLLSGLLGLLLGWAAVPAIAVALFLQVVLFGFGGLTSLGANICIMSFPAVAVYLLFGKLVGTSHGRTLFALSFFAGSASVLIATGVAGVLLASSSRGLLGPFVALSLQHIPVMIAEGFVTAFSLSSLKKATPELMAIPLFCRLETAGDLE